mgnify:FL=1
MKIFRLLGVVATAAAVFSCGGSKITLDSFVAEESGLNIQKITDESKNSVIGHNFTNAPSAFGKSSLGGCRKLGMYWGTAKVLSLSPDGQELAYVTVSNKQKNVMVRKASATGASTQRTFRDVYDFSYGPDGCASLQATTTMTTP